LFFFKDDYRKNFTLDNNQMVLLQIFDTSNREEYKIITETDIKKCDGFIFVYSIDNKNSFEEIKNFVNKILSVKDIDSLENIPCLLIGNKCDLEDKREVKVEDADKFVKENKIFSFLETSAKNGKNITECFHLISKRLIEITSILNKPSPHPPKK
jgi:small GTP-binding protein